METRINTFNYLTASFRAQAEPIHTTSEEEIEQLIVKYTINNNQELPNSTVQNVENIVLYISNLVYKNIEIPQKLISLFTDNVAFIQHLNTYLEKKLKTLTNSDSTYFFKEITTMFNIFTIITSEEIFESYDSYNFKALSKLFRELENGLIFLKRDDEEELFELKFHTYVIVLKALTQLCIINSTDFNRNKNTHTFIELMTESSNLLKYNIELDTRKISILNHIQGTHLYYFINIDELHINPENIKQSIKNYLYALDRVQDGYHLSKSFDFGNNENEVNEFSIFNNNSSILILDLFSKLKRKNIKLEEYNELDDFKRILKHYSDNFNYKFENNYELNNIEPFKKVLLDSLTFEYEENSAFTKIVNHYSILNDFIFSGKKYEVRNLRTIYSILFYCDDLKENIYLNIGQILSNTEKIKNDYYEFYKLRILDLIIHYYSKKDLEYEAKELFEDILTYVNKNKTASHLFSVYSKIYLSLALLYSRSAVTIKKAKNLYILYVETNNLVYLNSIYNKLNENILINFGKLHLHELHMPNNLTSKDSILRLGEHIIKRHQNYKKLQTHFEVTNGLVSISSNLLTKPLTQFKTIGKDIDELIQNKLFYGICKVSIIGFEKNDQKIEDAGFKEYLIELDSLYALKFVYPLTLEENFMAILKQTKGFLITNLNNIFNILKQNDKQLIDPITELYNITKLNIIIDCIEKEKLGFIEIYIKSIPDYNQKYGFEIGNKILKLATKRIKDICSEEIGTFKLSGTKIGILVANINKYQHLLDKLKTINVNFDDIDINLSPYVTYTIDRKSKLLISSSKSVDRAILFGEKQFINI